LTFEVLLTPRSALKSLPRSDTLFNALCWAIVALEGEGRLEELIGMFDEGRPPFALSSPLPRAEGEGGKVDFYPLPPRPRLSPSVWEEVSRPGGGLLLRFRGAKRLERAKYGSEGVFSVLLGKGPEGAWDELFRMSQEGRALVKGEFLLLAEEAGRLTNGPLEEHSKGMISAHASIDRLSVATAGGGEFFFEEVRFFHPRLSFRVLVRAADENVKGTIETAFKYLEDAGIGGERTSGLGRFKVEVGGEGSLPDGGGRRFLCLSRYIPAKGELDRSREVEFRYSVEALRPATDPRSGGGPFKGPFLALSEGSLLMAEERREVYGRLAGRGRLRHPGLCIPLFFGGD